MTEEEIKSVLYQARTFGIDSALNMYYRLSDNPWHTGTPTEEGLYLTVIKIDDGDGRYCYAYEPVGWKDGWCFRHFTDPIIAWQKITPFEADSKEEKEKI